MNTQTSLRGSSYSHIDRTTDPMKYVRRMDEMGANQFWRAIKAEMIKLLDVCEGDRVLDVGCGTGDDTQAIAQFVGASGQVVGVDSSSTMIGEAKKRSEELRLPVEYYVGDAQHLELPNNSFDSCRAERLLQHLDNPQQALAEMVRVARLGARLVVVEPDYGTITIKGSDPIVTGKLISCHCEHFRSPRIGMLIPLLYKRLGIVDVNVTLLPSVVISINERAEKHLINKYVNPAVAAGLVSEAEGRKWIEDLKRAELAGDFRHTTTIFLVGGRKPTS